MGRLVSIVLDEFGPELTRAQFDEATLALFENIAGPETVPTTTARQYLNVLWSKSRQSCNANQPQPVVRVSDQGLTL